MAKLEKRLPRLLTPVRSSLRRGRPGGNMGRRLALLLVCASTSPAIAASTAPRELYGKSLHLSWTTARTVADFGGPSMSHTTGAQMKVYISTQGRIFSEKSGGWGGRRGRGLSGFRQEISDSGDNREVSEWRAEGRSLVAYKIFDVGARRFVIDFNVNYTTCSLHVSFAKQAGTASIIQRHGAREVQSIEVLSTNCQVETGNVFGQ